NYVDIQSDYEKFRDEAKSWRHRVSSLVGPALEKVHVANLRSRALIRSLRVLNALQQQPDAAMAQPDLAKLGLPAEAIIDPFTGSPLLLRKVGNEWIIYSTGADLADNGGQIAEFKDIGIGP